MDGKRLVVVWLTAWSLLFSALLKANEKQLLLEELYESARLEQQLDWVRESLTLQSSEYALPRNVINIMNQVVEIRYSPDYFRSAMMTTLDEALTAREAESLLNWYSSPLGQKILRLEAEANNPANTDSIEAYIENTLSMQPPREDRLALIESLMEVMDVVNLNTDLAASASVKAQQLLREVMPNVDGKPMLSPRALKAKEKAVIRSELVEKMWGIFLFTYRTLPDREIRQYLEFTSDNAMQNFQRGQVQAIISML